MGKSGNNVKTSTKTTSVGRAVRDALASRIEHKRIVGTAAFTDFSASGVVNAITQAISQGDDISSRTGDVITIEKMKLRFALTNVTLTTSFFGRIIVFSDALGLGPVPAVTDVLATADVMSGYNTVFRQANRFKVYFDRLIPTVGGAASNNAVMLDVDFKLNKRVHYTGSSGATSNGKNSFYVLFITHAAGPANTNMYRWSYDVQYADA